RARRSPSCPSTCGRRSTSPGSSRTMRSRSAPVRSSSRAMKRTSRSHSRRTRTSGAVSLSSTRSSTATTRTPTLRSRPSAPGRSTSSPVSARTSSPHSKEPTTSSSTTATAAGSTASPSKIGRASCRERVEISAGDGIRDRNVTGVQTCALPICEPELDEIQYRYYTNSDAQVQAIRSGEVDFISGLSPDQFTALEGADNVELNDGDGRRFNGISINPGIADADDNEFGTGHEALKDKRVRQAIRAGIDIETLRNQVMQDYAQPATSFIPSVYPTWALKDDD